MATLQNSDGSYAFDTVANDPLKVQIFTLSNGLKVYMSVNKEAPRIQTLIATKAGSKNDPSDATGLAHYLEHMLFKGTSKIASLDWDSEKKLLQQISDLYEQHRAADSTERTAIYQQIDSLSGLAAQHTVSNEYDQLLSGLGAQNTNAFTFLDRTVYMNDIPSNELEKWLKLESERFSELVLRLFHTELETVYEEYNMTQTNDYRKVFQAMLQGLLPNHPYGTQSTIGTGEHLKAPSMEKIHEFFDSYYVPNNMAIILSGDFDPNEMAELVEQYWGKFKTKRLPKKSKSKPHSNAGTVTKEVLGKEKAAVQIGFKLEGGNADASLLAQLCVALLYNQKAGLMDVNLIQKQILGAQSSADFLAAKDYSFIFLYGEPRAGMSLDQVKDYLLKEISRLAMGHFEDWLIEAVINNLEITAIQNFQSNSGRAFSMLDAFIFDKEWSTVCTKFESMRRFSKADITAFAQNCLNKDKAVIVYKQEGEDLGVETVEKPLITPVEINRTASSDYAKVFNKLESPSLKPVFVDYDKALKQDQLDKQIPFDYLHNENNQTFDLVYVFEMGKLHDNLLPLAFKYLRFLATDQYTSRQLQETFFRLGLSFDASVRDDVAYLSLSGLDRNFEEGLKLMEHILANAVGDQTILKNMVSDIKKNRIDEKKDKQFILKRALLSYAYYGHNSPFKSRLDNNILEVLQPQDLLKYIHGMSSFEHKIFYYGSQKQADIKALLNQHHKDPNPLKPVLKPHRYVQQDIDRDKVVFVHYEGMVQAEILTVSKGEGTFDFNRHADARLYNEYFGYGLSSIVFQEIRESKALAYSAFAYYNSPENKDKSHYFTTFIGTQSDKLKTAIQSMNAIVQDMPIDRSLVHQASESILKKMQSERLNGSDIYWDKRSNQKRGFERNIRQDIYKRYEALCQAESNSVEALESFHQKYVQDKAKIYLVLGDRNQLDLEFLKSLGDFQEMHLTELFGY